MDSLAARWEQHDTGLASDAGHRHDHASEAEHPHRSAAEGAHHMVSHGHTVGGAVCASDAGHISPTGLMASAPQDEPPAIMSSPRDLMATRRNDGALAQQLVQAGASTPAHVLGDMGLSTEEAAAAAQKIQAIQRGKLARRQMAAGDAASVEARLSGQSVAHQLQAQALELSQLKEGLARRTLSLSLPTRADFAAPADDAAAATNVARRARTLPHNCTI
jgi:hypothetical protein